MSGGTMAAIILSVIVAVLIAAALLYFVRRKRSGKANVMYYKDMARTPLEDDFDIETDEIDPNKDKFSSSQYTQVQS